MMDSELNDDRLSIKNLLFKKAVANYIPTVPSPGCKIFPCTDCGDRFLFHSSYEYHVNRKSVKITYFCRYCNAQRIFWNRCNLLFHIRSHAFKTASINVSDLKLEPIPLSELPGFAAKAASLDMCPTCNENMYETGDVDKDRQTHYARGRERRPCPICAEVFVNTCALAAHTLQHHSRKPLPSTDRNVMDVKCYECKKKINESGVPFMDRRAHYTRVTGESHRCPMCLYIFSTKCALKAHIRIHMKCAPFYCPECGYFLANRNIVYPYEHNCEGFKMMRATARVECSLKCGLFHPNMHQVHLMEHMKKIYKCQSCIVACFSEEAINKHIQKHTDSVKKYAVMYQCDLCPRRLVMQPQLENHMMNHIKGFVFPCWACGAIFRLIPELLRHHERKLCKQNAINGVNSNINVIFRVVKKCNRCKKVFKYRCRHDEIKFLPNECPNDCSAVSEVLEFSADNQIVDVTHEMVKCHVCRKSVICLWDSIKTHYNDQHPELNFIDVKVVANRLDMPKALKSIKKKRVLGKIRRKRVEIVKSTEIICEPDPPFDISLDPEDIMYPCPQCDATFDNSDELENHILIHREPSTAYQCLECGESFTDKSTFAPHLLLEHAISDVDDYVCSKINCHATKGNTDK